MRYDESTREHFVAIGNRRLRLIFIEPDKGEELLEFSLSAGLGLVHDEYERAIEVPLVITSEVIRLPDYAQVTLLFLAARAFAHFKFIDIDDPHFDEAQKIMKKLYRRKESRDHRITRMYHDFIHLLGKPELYLTERMKSVEERYHVGEFGVPGIEDLFSVKAALLLNPSGVRLAKAAFVPNVEIHQRGIGNETLFFRHFVFEREDDAILATVA